MSSSRSSMANDWNKINEKDFFIMWVIDNLEFREFFYIVGYVCQGRWPCRSID